MKYTEIEKRFMRGEPVELTDASPETNKLRLCLEGDCCLGEWDFGGRVYWDDRRATAVLVPPNFK